MENNALDDAFHRKYWHIVRRIVRAVATIFIIVSVLLNKKSIAWLLGKATSFSETTITIIIELEILLFLIGILLLLADYFFLRKSSDKTKERVIALMISGCIILLLLLFAEIIIRIAYPQNTLSELKSVSPKIYENTTYISWKLKPNTIGIIVTGEFNATYVINSYGMRDKERNIFKRENITRILVLGDSCTVGFSVEQNETYPTLLEEYLNKKAKNKQIEVWNAGVLGYGPDAEYVTLNNIIEEIKPDIVLVGFYMGNDVQDLSRTEWITDNHGLPITVTSKIYTVQENQLTLKSISTTIYGEFLRYTNIFFLRWSHLYILLKNIIYHTGTRSLEAVPMFMENPSFEVQEELNENWQQTEMLLLAMKNKSEENNASFVIVFIPPRLQVDEKEWDYVNATFQKYNLSRELPTQRIQAWCVAYSVLCIDSFPVFYSLSFQETLYHTLSDDHLTALGNQRLAEIIAENLIVKESTH